MLLTHMWNTLHARPLFSQGYDWCGRPHPALSTPSSKLLWQDVVLVQVSSTAGHRRSSRFTSTLDTTLLAINPRRGDPHSNGLCRARFSQFRNVAPSTWLLLWPDSRVSIYCGTEVAQSTPPVVFENTWVPFRCPICPYVTPIHVRLWSTHASWTFGNHQVQWCLPGWASLAGTLELIVHIVKV